MGDEGSSTRYGYALPPADAAWLHMDAPVNPMVVNSVVTLGEVGPAERLREVTDTALSAGAVRLARAYEDQLRKLVGTPEEEEL